MKLTGSSFDSLSFHQNTLRFFLHSFGVLLAASYSFLHFSQTPFSLLFLILFIVLAHCFWDHGFSNTRLFGFSPVLVDLFEFCFISVLLPAGLSKRILTLGILVLPLLNAVRSEWAMESGLMFIGALCLTSCLDLEIPLVDLQIGLTSVYIILVVNKKLINRCLSTENMGDITVNNQRTQKTPPKIVEPDREETKILGISHDARNLLTTLHACLSGIAKENPLLESDYYWQSAAATAEILGDLLNSLLKTLLKDSLPPVQDERTDLPCLLEKTWKVISPGLKAKFLKGSFKIQDNCPLYLNIKEDTLRQIILNLIGNSIKFTDRGAISLKIGWEAHHEQSTRASTLGTDQSLDDVSALALPHNNSESSLDHDTAHEGTPIDVIKQVRISPNIFRQTLIIGEINFTKPKFDLRPEHYKNVHRYGQKGKLTISIVDNGCGIDKNVIGRLFQKRAQLHPDRLKREEGIGIGLWYTKSLIDKLNGTIEVNSHLNIGTETIVTLPCEVSEKLEIRPVMFAEVLKVLVLEEDTNTKSILKNYFDTIGFDVIFGHPLDYTPNRILKDIALYDLIVISSSYLQLDLIGFEKYNQKIICVDDGTKNVARKIFERNSPLRHILLQPDYATLNSILMSNPKYAAIIKEKEANRKKLILMVDDDPFNLSYLQTNVVRFGFPCLTAKNGEEALELFNQHSKNISLVITDTNMPRMNGLQLCMKVKEINPEMRVIAVTGYDDINFMKEAKRAGINQVYLKPVSVGNIKMELSRL